MDRTEERRNKKFVGKDPLKTKPIHASSLIPAEQEQTLAIQQAIDLAVQHHQAGDLPKAEGIYQQILQADPNQPIALHFLGLIAHQIGESDRAAIIISDALKIKPDYAEAHCNLGLTLKDLGRIDEAVTSYKNALAIKPDFALAHSNMGIALKDLGQLNEAVTSYNNALAIKPDYAEAHSNLGNTFQELGQLDEAVESSRKALAINPDLAEAHNNLGNTLKDLGQLDEAVESLLKAISVKPDFAEAHNNLGITLRELGKKNDAIIHHRHAIKLNPENSTFWAALANSLRSISFTTVDDGLLQDLLSLVDQPVVHPIDIVSPTISALAHHAEFSQILELAGAPKPDSSLDYQRMAAQLSRIPLFLRLLALTHFANLKLERMLTTLRRLMLQEAIAGKMKGDGLPFASALALHCFTNEYVFAVTDEESLSVGHLQKQISKLIEQKQGIPPSLIVTLGAYSPLHKFDWAQDLTEHEWDKEVSAVIERQILEPFTELSLRPQFPCLTPVQDTVSRLVRDQYEENPYPRWVKIGLLEKRKSIGAVLKAAPLRFDLGDYETPNSPEILIAGCGTGQNSLGTASRFKNARVLAIDLSLSSLSYAARKTNELAISNIEYAQADIMELGTLKRQFDLIESSGVFHHLGDPLTGWKVLVDLLKPRGLMKIGLYSETARQSIVAGRSMISEMGYTTSPEDIHRCRHDFITMAEDGDKVMTNIFNSPDFYSLSSFRDLLFHVKEHRFTLPQIKHALNVLNLKFLGFEMEDNDAMTKFKEIHPQKSDLASLILWHKFEQRYPDTFAGMYQFWCWKC